MKIINTLILLLLIKTGIAQLTVGGQYQVDIYKPYTPEAQSYIKLNDKVSSLTTGAYANIKILNKGKINWFAGVSYKHIKHFVEDKIRTYYWLDYGNGVTTQTKYVQENNDLDLLSTSHSFGLQNEVALILNERNKILHEVGLGNEIYFLEFFKSDYYFEGVRAEDAQIGATNYHPMTTTLSSPFLFSATNVNVFYRFRLNVSEKFSLAGKVSVGTNLYSDWDQFRKYAWLGLGLEIGFGNSKMNSKQAN